MNIAKKSTSKNGKLTNGISEQDNADTILILEDDVHHKSTRKSGSVNNHSKDNVDDVIICNVELPNHTVPKSLPTSITNITKTPESTNGQLKRSSESADHVANKKLKTTQPPGFNTLNIPAPGGSTTVLMTLEKLGLLIKDALREELIVYQNEMKSRYDKEIQDLKASLEHWKQIAMKFQTENIQPKVKEKTIISNVSQVKDLPCNLPPASANPVTSQHLKIIHGSNMPSSQPIGSIAQASNKNQVSTPAVVQSKPATLGAKEKCFIDLTEEDDSTKMVDHSNGVVNPSILGELSTSDTNKVTSHSLNASTNNIKIPAPPLPPSNQPAPLLARDLPPKPSINLTNNDDGVHLTWDCSTNPKCEEAVSYHIFSYQSQKESPNKFTWKRVGNVEALPLPMVCSLVKTKLDRQAAFAIRGVDRHCRIGLFSDVVILNREIIT